METFIRDLRHALRTLRQHPGLTVVALFTLALGIGANTAIFSLVDGVLLQPLPYAEPERLVMAWETMGDWETRWVAPGNFLDWRREAKAFEGLAAFWALRLNLTGSGAPALLQGQLVSANLFSVLGVAPTVGRTFTAADVEAGDAGAVMISHGFWQRHFGGTEALGQTLTLDGAPHSVIGVMPADFDFHPETDLWLLGPQDIPLRLPVSDASDLAALRDVHVLSVVGRLQPGVAVTEAKAELEAVAARLAAAYPDTNAGLGANVVPLHEQIVGAARPQLLLLTGAVGLVLLIACANVAHLLLAQGRRRRQEIAVRTALGAGRGQIVRQLLTESMLLALSGGGLGLLVALWGGDLLLRLSPENLPRHDGITLDPRLLTFVLLLSLGTSVLFGLLPALAASRTDLRAGIQGGDGRLAGGDRQRKIRRGLVVAEIGLAQVLLVGAGLLLVSFLRLVSVDPGFETRGLLALELSLPDDRYEAPAQRSAFFTAVQEGLAALPGATDAAVTTTAPFAGMVINRGYQVEGRPAARADEDITLDHQYISANYFSTLGIPLVRGRQLNHADSATAPRVVVINHALARRAFPGQDSLGQRIAFGRGEDGPDWRTVVGVMDDVRQRDLGEAPRPTAYTPYQQDRESWSRIAFVLRTAGDPRALAESARKVVLAADPAQPVARLRAVEDLLRGSLARQRFLLLLIGTFGLTALLLAAVGIYGVVAYTTSLRNREIALRMALGARRYTVLRLIVGESLTLALLGVSLGLAAAFGLGRLLQSQLFGVAARDPLTFLAIALVLTAVTLAAAYLPARRAARLDPASLLR